MPGAARRENGIEAKRSRGLPQPRGHARDTARRRPDVEALRRFVEQDLDLDELTALRRIETAAARLHEEVEQHVLTGGGVRQQETAAAETGQRTLDRE